MQAAVRPPFAAGVALVGASVIAASAIAPLTEVHLPHVHLPAIHMADVNLAAAVNPLEMYAQVFQNALANVGTLAENAVPGQLLQQLLANQLSSAATLGSALQTTGGNILGAITTQVPQLLQTAVTQLAAGNVAGATDALIQLPLAVGLPALNLLPALQDVLTKPLQNVLNVINSFTRDPLATELLLSGFIAPLISTPAAAATAVQNVIGALGTGNPMAVIGALLTAPATVADGLLNGGYGPDLAPLVGQTGVIVKAGGLLNSSSLTFDENGNIVVNTGGPIAAFQALLKQIATAIAPAPAAVQVAATDVASIPAAGAATVTLAAPSAPAAAPAKPAAAPEAGPEVTPEATPDKGTTDASAATPEKGSVADDPTKTPAASTPATSPDETKSESTTKDSTTKPESTSVSDGTKSDTKDVDVKTGNKVEPHHAGSAATTKSGDSAGSTTGHESTTEAGGTKTADTSTSGATKGADSASKASKASAS